MAAVDICNQALGECGARTTIASLNDATQAAVICKLNYDRLRKMLLRAAHWGFARKQVALAQLGTMALGTAPYPWMFKYAYPSDCLKVRYMIEPAPVSPLAPQTGEFLLPYTSSRQWRFLIGNDVDDNQVMRRCILTNLLQAWGVYTVDVVDTDIFDDLFAGALVAALASKLVIPLTGNFGMKPSFQAEAQGAVTNARVADGNEALPSTTHTPDWIQARGLPSDFYGLAPAYGTLWGGYDTLSWGE